MNDDIYSVRSVGSMQRRAPSSDSAAASDCHCTLLTRIEASHVEYRGQRHVAHRRSHFSSRHAGLHHLGYRTSLLFAQNYHLISKQAFPRNGGEKNYLEHLFPTPPRLITSIYAAHAVLLAYARRQRPRFRRILPRLFRTHPFRELRPHCSPPVRIGARAFSDVCRPTARTAHPPGACACRTHLAALKLLILLFVIGTPAWPP